MAINADVLIRRRPSDRALFWAAAIGFPLLVLIGYPRTYYFSPLFAHKPLANNLIHAARVRHVAMGCLFYGADRSHPHKKCASAHDNGLGGCSLGARGYRSRNVGRGRCRILCGIRDLRESIRTRSLWSRWSG